MTRAFCQEQTGLEHRGAGPSTLLSYGCRCRKPKPVDELAVAAREAVPVRALGTSGESDLRFFIRKGGLVVCHAGICARVVALGKSDEG